MANRSTFQTSLPRDVKRLIDLTPGDAHQIGELRRLFLDAHKHHKKWHSEMLLHKTNVDVSTEEPAEVPSASIS